MYCMLTFLTSAYIYIRYYVLKHVFCINNIGKGILYACISKYLWEVGCGGQKGNFTPFHVSLVLIFFTLSSISLQ